MIDKTDTKKPIDISKVFHPTIYFNLYQSKPISQFYMSNNLEV